MNYCFYPVILLGLFLAGASALAQDEGDEGGFTNNRLRDKSAYRQKTGLGAFTIGMHGIEKDEKEQAKTSDLEVGRIFEFKNNRIVPNIFEIETFLVNRVGTYEDSLYESLGIGAGTQLSYRKAGKVDKWFLRFAAIEPSEYYLQRYGVVDDRTVFELTVGRNYTLAPVANTTVLQERLALYSITASVPARALQNTAWSNANAASFLNDYLAAHYLQLKQADYLKYADMSDFEFIIQRSGVKLNERETRLLELHERGLKIQDAWEPTFKTLFGRAISLLLRDKCTLVFNVTESQAVQAFSELPDGRIQPHKAIDLDRMIQTYLNSLWKKFKTDRHAA